MAMTTARQLLDSLKATEVRHLAFLAGLDNSASKTQLVDRLPHLLAIPRFPETSLQKSLKISAPRKPLRILSIDMGIRNLAYCVLDVPASILDEPSKDTSRNPAATEVDEAAVEEVAEASPISAGKTSKRKKTTSKPKKHPPRTTAINILNVIADSRREIIPSALQGLTLSAWQRIAITPETLGLDPLPDPCASPPPTPTSPEPSPVSNSIDVTTSPTAPPSLQPTEFNPPHYARLAYALLSKTLLPHSPTVILIERQRWRSAGSPAILEWTVRVNMFEGMLWAVLETLRAEGQARGEAFPAVHPVNPKKVTGFWTGGGYADGDGGKGGSGAQREEKKERKKAKAVKEDKIAVAEGWIRGVGASGGGLRCAAAVREARGAFLAARGRRRAGGGGAAAAANADGNDKNGADNEEEDEEGVGEVEPSTEILPTKGKKLSKLDDLADCLLQGVAWVQWERNRRRILGLLEEDVRQSGTGHDDGRSG